MHLQVLKALLESVRLRCEALERPWDLPQQPSALGTSTLEGIPHTSLSGLEHEIKGQGMTISESSAAQALSPPASILVLLSGGVDSTLIAALADRSGPGAP